MSDFKERILENYNYKQSLSLFGGMMKAVIIKNAIKQNWEQIAIIHEKSLLIQKK